MIGLIDEGARTCSRDDDLIIAWLLLLSATIFVKKVLTFILFTLYVVEFMFQFCSSRGVIYT
jgi:hypothetical protein